MRAPVSIIVPTLNAAEDLPHTLASLAEGLDAGLIRELIVSDGGSRDQTLKIANAAGAGVVTGSAGRGGQLRRGAEAAGGDWLLFLHADTQLCTGWAETMLTHIRTSPDVAGYCRLAFRSKGLSANLVAGWANLRSKLFGLPYGDQALLVSRRAYDSVYGFTDAPLMEDVAIARALRGRLVALEAIALTSAAKYQRQGWMRQGARNLLILLKYFMGVDPKKLAERYTQK